MTGHKPAVSLPRMAGLLVRGFLAGVFVACLASPLLAPQRAAACDVSYGYKPSINFDKPNLGRPKPCSGSTALTGTAVLAVLAISALAAAGVIAFRRGEATAGPRTSQSGAAQALAGYLSATGAAPTHAAKTSQAGDHDAHPTP